MNIPNVIFALKLFRSLFFANRCIVVNAVAYFIGVDALIKVAQSAIVAKVDKRDVGITRWLRTTNADTPFKYSIVGDTCQYRVNSGWPAAINFRHDKIVNPGLLVAFGAWLVG